MGRLFLVVVALVFSGVSFATQNPEVLLNCFCSHYVSKAKGPVHIQAERSSASGYHASDELMRVLRDMRTRYSQAELQAYGLDFYLTATHGHLFDAADLVQYDPRTHQPYPVPEATVFNESLRSCKDIERVHPTLFNCTLEATLPTI